MKILYHLATLPPKLPQAEAISQEIASLRHHFESDQVWVNPNQQVPIFVPRLLFGWHKLRQLRIREGRFDLHHFYNPDPFPFPYLRWLGRPVIYSITCGVGERRPNLAFLRAMAGLAVSDERSLNRLKAWGLDRVYLVRVGIDQRRFSHTPLPLERDIRLMVASAPWTPTQFRTKGVEALLEAAQQEPRLRLTFLWRGVLSEMMYRRVADLGLEEQVEIIDQQVEVNQILAGVHATISLASDTGIIKAQPHALLDSLAAGKPVLVSRAIPMSDYVAQTGCGTVVEQVTAVDILMALAQLRENYTAFQAMARRAGQQDFTLKAMLDSYQEMYERVMRST